jgi:hypothetical protein
MRIFPKLTPVIASDVKYVKANSENKETVSKPFDEVKLEKAEDGLPKKTKAASKSTRFSLLKILKMDVRLAISVISTIYALYLSDKGVKLNFALDVICTNIKKKGGSHTSKRP